MLGFVCIRKSVLPIGALTSKPYTFGSRPWELKSYEIFDPTSGFHQSIVVNVMNNMIQRVLPSNFWGSVSYNWIPNRLRFFFESFLPVGVTEHTFPKIPVSVFWPLEPSLRNYGYRVDTRLVSRSWVTSTKKLVTKFVGLQSNIAGFLGSPSYNLDLYSELEFDALNSEFTCLAGYSFPPRDSRTNFDIFFRDAKTLQFAEIVSRVYSKIFLISFNPYFSHPNLTQYLYNLVSNKSLGVYTFMYRYFHSQLKYFGASLTTENLTRLFSGKHIWSPYLFKSSSLVIIDIMSIRGLPSPLLDMILEFIDRHSENVYLVNSGYSDVSYTSINNNFFTKANLKSHLVFGGSNFFVNQHRFPVVVDVVYQLFSGETAYSYLFDYDIVQFSQYNNFGSGYLACPKFWFPLSSFVSFSAHYGFAGDSKIYKLNRVVNSNQRPVGSFFHMLRIHSKIARKYSHFCLNFCSVVFFAFSIMYNLFNNGILSIFLNNSAYGYGYLLNNCINLFRWYGFEKIYFIPPFGMYNVSYLDDVCSPMVLKSVWIYPNYRSNLDIVSLNDNFVNYSKTLVLDREFRISRFNNFAGK